MTVLIIQVSLVAKSIVFVLGVTKPSSHSIFLSIITVSKTYCSVVLFAKICFEVFKNCYLQSVNDLLL